MTVRIMVGDALSQLAELPDESVYCVVTSPPYWGLRAYKGDPGMIGLELTFDEHLENLVEVFREVCRVLHNDGTLWLNYGDAYCGYKGDNYPNADPSKSRLQKKSAVASSHSIGTPQSTSFKPKDLMMMPARVVMALQADGWWLRSEIIWHKPNPMPESCTDRPTSAHEKMFLLTKSARYFYDAEAVRVGNTPGSAEWLRNANGTDTARRDESATDSSMAAWHSKQPTNGANLRNVWSIPTFSYSEAHFATFPPALVEPCIKAGTSAHGVCGECGAPWVRDVDISGGGGNKGCNATVPDGTSRINAYKALGGGTYQANHITTGWSPSCDHDASTIPATVLDPFAGAGTVGLVADRLQRDAILIEISPDYAAMARRRIEADAGGLFGSVVVDDTEKSAERLGGDADFDGLMGASE